MNPNPKITIDSVLPNDPAFTDGNHLLTLYFELRDTDKNYRLYHSDGTKIQTEPHHLRDKEDLITFSHGGLSWSITDFKVFLGDDALWHAKGCWAANHGKSKDGDADDEETGTFQAQAGGHPVPEVSSSASA